LIETVSLLGFLSLGLLGGFGHCVGMCSPFVLFVSRRYVAPEAGRAAALRAQLWYTAGRVLTYALLGALAGALGGVVQLAGALLFDPDLVVLDEPGSGLDPVNVVLVRRLLRELAAEGKAILLSTHQMGEAEKLCDEIVLVHAGKVVRSGPLAEVKASGGRDAVHLEFAGDGAFLTEHPAVASARVDTNRAELRLAPGGDAQEVLAAAAARLRVLRFEVVAPSLEEVFLEAVGETAPPEVAA